MEFYFFLFLSGLGSPASLSCRSRPLSHSRWLVVGPFPSLPSIIPSPLKMADAPSPAAPKQFTQQEVAKVRQQDPRASGPSSAASR